MARRKRLPTSRSKAARTVSVHFAPQWVDNQEFAGATVVVMDVLRATTTIIHALAAGCEEIRPAGGLDQARHMAQEIPAPQRLLIGECQARPVDGFDLSNSPCECLPARCGGRVGVLATTNGSAAILHARTAEQVLIGAFVNFSALCESLRGDTGPLHLLCAGTVGTPALEDILLAGAIVDYLADEMPVSLNDAARVAWDAHDHHGQCLVSALELSRSGQLLLELGCDADIKAAASIDRFPLVPHLAGDTGAIVPGSVGYCGGYFRGDSGLLA